MRGFDECVPSCESPLSFGIAWRKSESGDRSEIGERQRIFVTVGEHSVLPFLYLYAVSDTLLLHIRATLRWVRHDSAAQFVSVLLQIAPADLIFGQDLYYIYP